MCKDGKSQCDIAAPLRPYGIGWENNEQKQLVNGNKRCDTETLTQCEVLKTQCEGTKTLTQRHINIVMVDMFPLLTDRDIIGGLLIA